MYKESLILTIKVYSIEKHQTDSWDDAVRHYVRLSLRYAKVESVYRIDKQTQIAQANGRVQAQEAYSRLYAPYVKEAFCICLDEDGEQMDSVKFSSIFDGKHSEIRFFIGGAFGFNNEFSSKCSMKLALSKLTMTHQLAKVALWEQIYRALTINASHPYHK